MQATLRHLPRLDPGPGGRDFYFRQLWDMKGSVDTTTLQPPGLAFYGAHLRTGARPGHARTGDAVAISAYLGTSDTFDGAIADFARDLRRRERARPRGVRRGDRRGPPLDDDRVGEGVAGPRQRRRQRDPHRRMSMAPGAPSCLE